MEKLDFCDLVVLAKSIFVDYDKLLCQSSGALVSPTGLTYERNSDAGVSAESASDVAYDKVAVLIKVLKGIQEYRPLPF